MGIDHIFQSPLLIVTIRGFSTCEEINGAFDELALDDRITSTESIMFGKIRLLCAFMKSNGLAAELFPSFTKAMTWALLG